MRVRLRGNYELPLNFLVQLRVAGDVGVIAAKDQMKLLQVPLRADNEPAISLFDGCLGFFLIFLIRVSILKIKDAHIPAEQS